MSPRAQKQQSSRSPGRSPRYRVAKLSEVLSYPLDKQQKQQKQQQQQQSKLTSPTSPRSRMSSTSSSASAVTANGGPTVQSRRSHTKSRKGCKTCKKRHIRCDETTPQCRNCTKHNVRCDYQDGGPVEGIPDLKMTPQIERELDTWRKTGVYPFPNLGLESHPSPTRYSPTDLRLIHHISSIASQMQAVEPSNSAIWTKRVPMFLTIASKHDFVMHSLLGLSASHLSWLTESYATLQLAYQHRGLAFQGLQQSIGDFSKENSDAVLAASILLSWQVTDWRSWASLLQGTSTVIDAMQAWKHESEFAEFMEEGDVFTRGSLRQQILDPQRDRYVVDHVYQCLLPLMEYFRSQPQGPDTNDQALKGLEDLVSFVQELQDKIPAHSAEEQFHLMHPLREWLFFLPIDFLRRGRTDPSVMVLLAHFYGVALAVEPLFPAVGAAYFGTMSVGPIEQIHRTLLQQATTATTTSADAAAAARGGLELMGFPLEMVKHFRERMDWRRATGVVPPPPPSTTTTTAAATATSSPLHTNHLGGWDFGAFPEYAMVNTGGGYIPPPPHPPQDVQSSFTASDFIAHAMWREGS